MGSNPGFSCDPAPSLEPAGDAGAAGVWTDTELASRVDVRKRPGWQPCWDAALVLSRSAAGLQRALGFGAAEAVFPPVSG